MEEVIRKYDGHEIDNRAHVKNLEQTIKSLNEDVIRAGEDMINWEQSYDESRKAEETAKAAAIQSDETVSDLVVIW